MPTWAKVSAGAYQLLEGRYLSLCTVYRRGSSWRVSDDGGPLRIEDRASWPTLRETKATAGRCFRNVR